MTTSTTYIPTELQLKNGVYNLFKQRFIGNTKQAKLDASELRKYYEKPKFIIRRLGCSVVIYKKV